LVFQSDHWHALVKERGKKRSGDCFGEKNREKKVSHLGSKMGGARKSMEPQSAQEENVESPEKVPMPKAVFASFVGANKDFASTADKSFRPCRVDSPLVYSAERQRKNGIKYGDTRCGGH
jgi:hypothetical protein